jgi:hypothetical protein
VNILQGKGDNSPAATAEIPYLVKYSLQHSKDLINMAIFVITLISGLAAGELSPLPCKIFTTT